MSSDSTGRLFEQPRPERSSIPLAAWGVAGAVVLVVLGILLLTSHPKPAVANTVLPLDPYAANLVFSNIEMSESASLSGAKVTYVDGRVRNTGARTVTSAALQVLFANDLQQPSQIQAAPLSVIRTHEPYIDTEPLSAAPLAPAQEAEFRLTFEDVSASWNQQIPEIRTTRVALR